MTLTADAPLTTVCYDELTGDYAILANGECIGYAPTQREGQRRASAHVCAALDHPHTIAPAPEAATDAIDISEPHHVAAGVACWLEQADGGWHAYLSTPCVQRQYLSSRYMPANRLDLVAHARHCADDAVAERHAPTPPTAPAGNGGKPPTTPPVAVDAPADEPRQPAYMDIAVHIPALRQMLAATDARWLNALNTAFNELAAATWTFAGEALTIASRTNPRVRYRVSAHGCQCTAYAKGIPCWHRAAFRLVCRAAA